MQLRVWSVGLLLLGLTLFPACAQPAQPANRSPAEPAQAARPAAKAPPGDYFAGKTVTLLLAYSAGGPSDVFARLLSPYLQKYIPGQPTVIVEYKAGAGGLIGANHLYAVARKDGLTLGLFTVLENQQVMESSGVEYDATKFIWLGSAVETQVAFAHHSLGVKAPEELPGASMEIVIGGLSPDNPKDMALRTFLNLLGLKYKYVTGYPGNNDARAALLRGEINVFEESMTGWATGIVPLVNEGTAYNMVQRGIARGDSIVRDPRVSELPTYQEVAVALKGEAIRSTVEYRALDLLIKMASMQRELVYPPGVAPELVETMRQAVADSFADPEFQATAQKQFGFHVEFVTGAQAHDQVVDVTQRATADRAALEYLKLLAKERE
jgi:tripartite-type tricarboxylate transporter receptor subunit TctC